MAASENPPNLSYFRGFRSTKIWPIPVGWASAGREGEAGNMERVIMKEVGFFVNCKVEKMAEKRAILRKRGSFGVNTGTRYFERTRNVM
jgi:hypothetical protein